MNSIRLSQIRNRLSFMLDEIIHSHAGGLKELSEGNAQLPDAMDSASQETDIKLKLAQRERERSLARDIRWALKQIDEGAYGICEECDENIAFARLLAFPATTLCVRCKALQEEGQAYGLAR